MSSRWLLFTTVFALSLAAHAESELSARAQDLADRLAITENQMDERDRAEIRFGLERLEWILGRYQDIPSSSLSCISNGESSVWEKFRLTDLASGKTLGGATSLETCQRSLKMQKNSLICLSNGESSVWEKFKIYDVKFQKSIGGTTSFETCARLVQQSNRDVVCASNGESSVWEKFSLHNRRGGQVIGGATQIDACLATIPR